MCPGVPGLPGCAPVGAPAAVPGQEEQFTMKTPSVRLPQDAQGIRGAALLSRGSFSLHLSL